MATTTSASSSAESLTSLLRGVMGGESLTFLVGSVLHLGIPVFGLTEPQILPATIVEGLCGVALLTAAVTYPRPVWGPRVARWAHVVAIAGVLLGMAALATGAGPRTPLNTTYHRAILAALLVTGGLVFVRKTNR